MENKNALLKKCVEFYSDSKNYEKLESGKTQIEMDNGFIAIETLKMVKNLEKQENELIEQYNQMKNGTYDEESIKAEIENLVNQADTK